MNFMEYGPDLERKFRETMAQYDLDRAQRRLLNKIAEALGRPYESAGWPGPHPIQVRLGTYMTIANGRASKHFPLVIQICKRIGLQAVVLEQGGALMIWR